MADGFTNIAVNPNRLVFGSSTTAGDINAGAVNISSGAQVMDVFETRRPRDKSLRVVQLTKGNIKRVAASLVRHVDVAWVDDETIVAGGPDAVDQATFIVGDWVVEGYDYEHSYVIYRHATHGERVKYDLR